MLGCPVSSTLIRSSIEYGNNVHAVFVSTNYCYNIFFIHSAHFMKKKENFNFVFDEWRARTTAPQTNKLIHKLKFIHSFVVCSAAPLAGGPSIPFNQRKQAAPIIWFIHSFIHQLIWLAFFSFTSFIVGCFPAARLLFNKKEEKARMAKRNWMKFNGAAFIRGRGAALITHQFNNFIGGPFSSLPLCAALPFASSIKENLQFSFNYAAGAKLLNKHKTIIPPILKSGMKCFVVLLLERRGLKVDVHCSFTNWFH